MDASLEEPIFNLNFFLKTIKPTIDKECPEPKWREVFFDRLPANHQTRFLSYIRKEGKLRSPFFYLLRGLALEFGINGPENLEKAYAEYLKGAELNDYYCYYRLYFIQINKNDRFGVKRDRDEEMLYLIKSSAYFDYFCDDRFEFYPTSQLSKHLSLEDPYAQNTLKLIRKYGLNNPSKRDESLYLENWLYTKFFVSQEQKNKGYAVLRELADAGHSESCYYLGEMIYHGKLNEVGTEAKGYYMKAADLSNVKAFVSLGAYFEEREKNLVEALRFYCKAASAGCFKCFDYLAGFFIQGNIVQRNIQKGLKYFIKGFWLGYLYCEDHFVLVTTNKALNEEKLIKPENKQDCLELALSLNSYNSFTTPMFREKGSQYYILSLCYERGLGGKPDLHKALDTITKGLLNKEVKEYRYLHYREARIYDKLGKKSASLATYAKSFEEYNELMKKTHKGKYSTHYFRMGKFLEKGWANNKQLPNYTLACDYFKKGSQAQANSILLYEHYSKKSVKKYNELQKIIKFKSISFEALKEKVLDVAFFKSKYAFALTAEKEVICWSLKSMKRKFQRKYAKKNVLQGLNFIRASESNSLFVVVTNDELRVTVSPVKKNSILREFLLKETASLKKHSLTHAELTSHKCLALATINGCIHLVNFYTATLTHTFKNPQVVSPTAMFFDGNMNKLIVGFKNSELISFEISNDKIEALPVTLKKNLEGISAIVPGWKEKSFYAMGAKKLLEFLSPDGEKYKLTNEKSLEDATSLCFASESEIFVGFASGKIETFDKSFKRTNKISQLECQGHVDSVSKIELVPKLNAMVTVSLNTFTMRKWFL